MGLFAETNPINSCTNWYIQLKSRKLEALKFSREPEFKVKQVCLEEKSGNQELHHDAKEHSNEMQKLLEKQVKNQLKSADQQQK